MKTIQQRFETLLSHLNAEENEMALEIKSDLEIIGAIVKDYYESDFDYEQPHWENGNYDDSFDYGRECGMNDVAGHLAEFFVEYSSNGY